MDAAEKLAPEVGTAAACRAMGVSRATLWALARRRSCGGRHFRRHLHYISKTLGNVFPQCSMDRLGQR